MTRRKVETIPLFDLKVSSAARAQVNDTLRSGWLTAGPKVKAFEGAVSKLTGVKYAAAAASGTQALHLTLAAYGGLLGREVITTPYTFVATVEAILQAGGTPVPADIDRETLTIDPDEVERKITKKTAAVVPVDLAGYPCEYDRLNDICDSNRLLLVSDAAHAIGGAYRGKSVAQMCDAAVYSFYSTKNVTTGEGGIAVSRHKALVDRIRLIARHGLTRSTYERKQANVWEYDVVEFGWKANMSELSAALGLGEMENFKTNQAARKRLAERYLRNLKQYGDYVIPPVVRPDHTHGWHLFIIKLKTEALRIGRDRFIGEMAARGVECGVHYKPVYEMTWYRKAFGWSGRDYPNTDWAWKRGVTLPLYPMLTVGQVDRVCEVVGDVMRRFGR